MNSLHPAIGVVGLGYIGLPTAAMFAMHGAQVLGIDVNQNVVDTINRGAIHIVEPGLEEAVRAAVEAGRLRATTDPEAMDAFLIAVPTPFKGANHKPDLSYIAAAAAMIAPVLRTGNLVILESTSPVGTTEALAQWLANARPDLSFPQNVGEASDIRIAYCPERVLPGKVMGELIENDRVIGGMTSRCAEQAAKLYNLFVKGACIRASNPRTAEMTKLTENSFRDVNIAFANELSLICDKLSIDVWELIALANRHPRVKILQPGPGVGGHCIACDPWFIVASAPEQARLIRTAREVNDGKPRWVLTKINEAIAAVAEQLGKSAGEVSLACYGVAFKPDIDDLRDSPALAITRALVVAHPGPLWIVEPNIERVPDGLGIARLAEVAQASAADIHVLLVDHAPFKSMAVPAGHILDFRGVWKRG